MYRIKALISSSRLPAEGYINVIIETQKAHDIDLPFPTGVSQGGRGTLSSFVS